MTSSGNCGNKRVEDHFGTVRVYAAKPFHATGPIRLVITDDINARRKEVTATEYHGVNLPQVDC